MTTILKQLLVFLLAISIVISFGYVIGGDRYLPWVKKEVLYASLYNAEGHALENGHYTY